jgi:hypothetical protein
MVDRRVPGAQKGEPLWKCPSGDFERRATRQPKCPRHPDQTMVPTNARKTGSPRR